MAERTRRRSAASGTSRRSTARSQGDGGRLSRDYSDEEYREPGEGYQGEQPTKGLYTAELFSINDHTKQDEDEATSVRWGFRLAEGSENKHGDDVTGWPDFMYTNENTAWKEQQMLVALGVIKPGGKVNLTYDAIIKKAKPCTVRVGVERYIPEDGSDPEWRGRMNAFMPLRDPKAVGTKSRRAKDEPVEDVFEDDEDTEEDGDEEETPAPSRRSTSRSRRKAAEPEPEDDEDEDEEEGDEGDDEDEDYDPDELAAELADLSLAALKKRARDEFEVKISRGMTADDIIDAILETLDADDEDEPEEEPPPPPKRAARTSARRTTKAAATTTRRKRGNNNEPPF